MNIYNSRVINIDRTACRMNNRGLFYRDLLVVSTSTVHTDVVLFFFMLHNKTQ